MIFFWLSTIVLIILGCIFIVMPAISKKELNNNKLRDDLNKTFYNNRLVELEAEVEYGLIDDQQELIADLKQSLLDDIPVIATEKESQIGSPMSVMIPSFLFVIVMSYGLYMNFGAAKNVEHWLQVRSNSSELYGKWVSTKGNQLTKEEFSDLKLALRTQLYDSPNDADGWLSLGRMGLSSRDYNMSQDAMKKAYELAPARDDIKLGYAQALMLSQDDLDRSQARFLLEELSQRENVNPNVLSILAFEAFEQEDYRSAADYWTRLQAIMDPEDSRYEMLSASIKNALRKLEQQSQKQ